MAEALARRGIEKRGWTHVEVRSAGVATSPGHPASDGAYVAAERGGLDLSDHRTRLLTEELVEESDVILVMTPGHLARVEELGGGDRAALLTRFAAGDDPDAPDSVQDPFGGTDALYNQTFRQLENLVDEVLARLETILAP